MSFARIPDRATGRIDAFIYGRGGYDPTVPDGLQKLRLADDAIRIPYEIDQQVEDLRFDRDRLRAASKFAARHVEDVIVKRRPRAVLGKRHGRSPIFCLRYGNGAPTLRKIKPAARPSCGPDHTSVFCQGRYPETQPVPDDECAIPCKGCGQKYTVQLMPAELAVPRDNFTYAVGIRRNYVATTARAHSEGSSLRIARSCGRHAA